MRIKTALIGMSDDSDRALGGMTIWCLRDGDPEKAEQYYGKLEFAKKTGWFRLLQRFSLDG